jgi:hypothetical protein
VGPGEAAAVKALDPMAVDPLTEDLTSWVVSGELVVPLGDFMLLSEVQTGRGTNLYLGGFKQRPRVDPATGKHQALDSMGGYVQLSYMPTKDWVVVALAGEEKIRSGLDFGVGLDGARIERNRVVLSSISRTFGPGLKLGVQVMRMDTTYPDFGNGSMVGILGDCVISFF